MATEVKLPDLGMDTDEALLIDWMKQPGDSISQGDVIAEVETDKTTVEVESPVGGTVLEWKYDPGDNLTIGEVIGFVGEAGEEAPNGSGGDAQAEAPVTEQAKGEKPTSADSKEMEVDADTAPDRHNGAARTDNGRIKASPVAKRVAENRGIDLAQVSGTGPGGRIVKDDVESFDPDQAQSSGQADTSQETEQATEKAKPAASMGGKPTYGKLPEGEDFEHEEVTRLRNRIAERMVSSQQQIPHFYITIEVNVDPLLALRKQLNAGVEDKADRISVNDMIVKAVALAARNYPQANKHWYGDQYVVNKRVNVGIAVALDNGGLMNVVSHDADRTSLRMMARENREKIGRARAGKVQPRDVSGETITVSNLGMFGVDNFLAIVNPPASAIVAVGAAVPTPIVKPDGQIGVGSMMKLTLSADHRVLNGAEGGEYAALLKEYLENPMRLI